MDLWNKMLINIAESFFSSNVSENELLLQLKKAIQEEAAIWKDMDDFLDPCAVTEYQNRWHAVYSAAKNKSTNPLFMLKLTGRNLNEAVSVFIHLYEQLPAKVHTHNQIIAKERVEEASKLILPVEGKRLDSQQLECITKQVNNHLVLAGAGTGKTTTIVGYVKYLIKKGFCNPNDILVLSFTNNSSTEMSERLEKEIGQPITAQTFHKLGLSIITSVEGKVPNIYSKDIRPFVRQQLEELIRKEDYLRKLYLYLAFNRILPKSEFDFKSEEEYQTYLSYNQPITLKKEVVKSYGELDIANFLTQNGIEYVYEPEYPVDTRTSQYGQYHPDFFLPKYGLYIEYYGINRQGEVPSYFTGKDGKTATQTYLEGMEWKRELHRNNNTTLIEMFAYEKLEDQLLSKLEKRLKDAGVVLTPISSGEIWKTINEENSRLLDQVSELFGTVITLIKSNNCSIDDLRIRNKSLMNVHRNQIVIDLVEPVYQNYLQALRDLNAIDFNDMINLASEYVTSGKYHHNYRYVIIDEYQDISQARYRLLYAMREQRDYRLFCVGDDWQSIYRFSGSDIGFILNFEKYWGASEISKIETTYRFSQSLINISGTFILKNPAQKRKHLRSGSSSSIGFAMEEISGYTEAISINFMTNKLNDLPIGSSVLFLGRYKFDIKILEENGLFHLRYDNETKKAKIIYSKRPDLVINYMTVHGSKGLQADYVFLLNNKAHGMGFPSQIADAPILQLLLDNCDQYPYAEERRLFYVAITRAKKKVWLLTIKGNESSFVKEILTDYGKDMKREQYTCPQCGGRLVKRSGRYGEFYGCSNYKTTGCKYTRNITKKAK